MSLYFVGDGCEVLAVEAWERNAIAYAISATGGTVHLPNGSELRGTGKGDETIYCYQAELSEKDDLGNWVFGAERAAAEDAGYEAGGNCD